MGAKVILVIHRKSANRDDVKQAVKFAKGSGCKFRVLVPFNKKEKLKIIREAVDAGATRIIAGGGDGTINAATNALMKLKAGGHDIEMGVLPLGTANDFARGMQLPTTDLGECLRIACSAKAAPIDVGQVNGRYFVNVASLGFGSEVTATTPVGLKKALGGAAYSLSGLVKAMNLDPYQCSVHVPGEEAITGRMLFMAVGNNRFAGGGYEVSPAAQMDDGLLDLSAITVDDGFSFSKLQSELLDPSNPSNSFIRYRQLPEFSIKSERELYCNLDGEPLISSSFDFSISSKGLRLVQP